jgi:WD repeat-containing protein 7
VSTILVDLEGFLSEAMIAVRAVNVEKKPTISSTPQRLRALLSTILTPGLSQDIDNICRERLQIAASSGSVGLARCADTLD